MFLNELANVLLQLTVVKLQRLVLGIGCLIFYINHCDFSLLFPADNAPVTKGLMGFLFLTCTSLNVPLFAHLRRYLICRLPEVISKGEVR